MADEVRFAARLEDLEDLLRRIVDELTFDSAVVLEIARRTGIELPFDIDRVNDRAAELRQRIDGILDEHDDDA